MKIFLFFIYVENCNFLINFFYFFVNYKLSAPLFAFRLSGVSENPGSVKGENIAQNYHSGVSPVFFVCNIFCISACSKKTYFQLTLDRSVLFRWFFSAPKGK